MDTKVTAPEEDKKILPWIVVLIPYTNGKIILKKDLCGKYVLLKKEGGSLAKNLEFSYEDTIEKIFKENKIEYEGIGKLEILGDKKISHPEARKITVKLEILNGKIMSPHSHVGLYFPGDILGLPSKAEDRKIIAQYFKIERP
ncbi:MAG: hypothetical protein WC099_03075 [Candidatus Paceibacterota bacterium]